MKIIPHTKKTLRTYYFIERERLQKYLFGLLSIVINEADIEKKNKSTHQ